MARRRDKHILRNLYDSDRGASVDGLWSYRNVNGLKKISKTSIEQPDCFEQDLLLSNVWEMYIRSRFNPYFTSYPHDRIAPNFHLAVNDHLIADKTPYTISPSFRSRIRVCRCCKLARLLSNGKLVKGRFFASVAYFAIY